MVVTAATCCGQKDCPEVISSRTAMSTLEERLKKLARDSQSERVEPCEDSQTVAACVDGVCVDDVDTQCVAHHRAVDESLNDLWPSIDLTCETHADCTRLWPASDCSPECSDTPIAKSDLARVQGQLDRINEKLCAPIADAGCAPPFFECAPYASWLPTCNGGTCQALYGCDKIGDFIDGEVQAAAEADVSCSADADCTTIVLKASCSRGCASASVSLKGKVQFDKRLHQIETTLCAEYTQSYCSPPDDKCDEQSSAAHCEEGRCALDEATR
jgi:hypothetical protein